MFNMLVNTAPFWATALIVFIVCLFRFFRARMRHREILAAIEKGVALPELPSAHRIPNWITSTAIGIGLIVFSPAFILVGLGASKQVSEMRMTILGGTAFPSLLCFSIGLFFLIRGLLLKKHIRQTGQSQ